MFLATHRAADAEHGAFCPSCECVITSAAGIPVHVAAATGHVGNVTFTPTEAGEYEYYCTVAGHKVSGMVGKLTVVAP